MPEPGAKGSWSVPVLHGPSSADNLLTTLVAWARRRNRDPRSYHLSMVNDGKTLLLKGFDLPSLKDFLRYAEYSSIPALECGKPMEIAPAPPQASPAPAAGDEGLSEVDQPGPPAGAGPAGSPPEPAAPVHPPTLSSSSIQMVIGTAQLLADRSTNVRAAEHWVTSLLATPDLKSEEVVLLLRLIGDPELDATRLALAESAPLRREGESLLKVSAESIPDALRSRLASEGSSAPGAARSAASGPPASSPAPAGDEGRSPDGGEGSRAPAEGRAPGAPSPALSPEALLRARIFAQGLEARAQRWRDIGERLQIGRRQGQPALESLLEGAVFINEEEGRVAWVVPHSNSALVKALVAYVHESHRLLREEAERRGNESGSWVSPRRRETLAALETARRSTLMALRVGVELRWVVLLSTGFNDGQEEGFGLPIGTRPPWEEAPPTPVLAAPSSPSSKVTVKKKVGGSASALARFASDLDAPLDAVLVQSGVEVSLLKRSRTAPKPSPPASVTSKPATLGPPKPKSVAAPPS